MKGTPDSPHVRLHALGTYLPARRESTLERGEQFGFSHDFLEDVLGFVSRSIKESNEATSDLCVRAFQDLCDRSRLNKEDVQLVIVVTQNPDVRIPHTAAIVHNKLGLAKPCMTFDISQGCAGYCHGVAVAAGVMEMARLDHALLFTCDPYTSIIDRDDKDVALLFGDAATASYFTRVGSGYELIDANFGTMPGSHECLRCEDLLKMDGQAVFSNAAKQIPPSISALLQRNEMAVDDVDRFLLHQASKYIVEFIRTRLKIPPEKAPFVAAQYGNTVSSSIPLILQEHVAECELELLLLSGFGIGFSWGNNLLKAVRAEL
jgi:3-oxoacyl-[acyl-carrier-protein] synthase-3